MGERQVSLLPGPTSLCVVPGSGAVYLASVTGGCARPFTQLTVPSAASNAYFCPGALGLLVLVTNPSCPRGAPVYAVTEPPQAVNDVAGVTEGAPTATGNVLANDLYISLNPATVTALSSSGVVTTIATGFRATRSDGSTLTISSSGAYSFTASAGFFEDCSANATDVFGYTITNGYGQSSSASLTVTEACPPRADLSIRTTDNTTMSAVAPGSTIAYSVVVSNSGPDSATGATVSDLLPGGLSNASWQAVGSDGASATTTSGTGSINDTVDLPSGSQITFTIDATVVASASGSLSDTATVTPPSSVTDPIAANNTNTDTVTLTPEATLAITNSDGVTNPGPGQMLTYTVVVSNLGPSNATDVLVFDANGLSDVSSPSLPPGVTFNQTTDNWDVGTLAPGASVTLELSGFVPANASGTFTTDADADAADATAVSADDSDTINVS